MRCEMPVTWLLFCLPKIETKKTQMDKTQSEPLILVIEDDEALGSLIAYFLRRGNFRTVIARDGIEGLQLARELSPALVLCDSSLPELNGVRVIRALREDPATARIPLILMSGCEKPIRLGAPSMDAFLKKPFAMDEMLGLVRCFTHDVFGHESPLSLAFA
jgi:two-component system phosphate regulon response regulator PhoB